MNIKKVTAFSIMLIMCLGMLTACGKPTTDDLRKYSGRTFSGEGYNAEIVKMNEKEKVPVPEGFNHVEGTTKEKGFVIKDKLNNNEFVWVPLADILTKLNKAFELGEQKLNTYGPVNIELEEAHEAKKQIESFLAEYPGQEPENEEMKNRNIMEKDRKVP